MSDVCTCGDHLDQHDPTSLVCTRCSCDEYEKDYESMWGGN
jgi:hypothetical protein